jgi:hypothetical protein
VSRVFHRLREFRIWHREQAGELQAHVRAQKRGKTRRNRGDKSGMDRAEAAQFRFSQMDRCAKIEGLGCDFIRLRKAFAVRAENHFRIGRSRSFGNEAVDVGLVKWASHDLVFGFALLDDEFGEVNLIDNLRSEEAIEFRNDPLADHLAAICAIECIKRLSGEHADGCVLE